MNANELAAQYQDEPAETLREIVVGDYDLSRAVLAKNPEMAQDAGFELFDVGWAKRYWRNILSEVSDVKALDKVQSWAFGASIAEVAKLIVAYYVLPPVALPAAVALAVILIRAAAGSGTAAGKP